MHNSSIAVSRSIPEAFWKDIKPVIPNVNLEKYKYIPFTRLRKDERPGTAAAIKASIGLILPSIFRAIISEKGSWQGSVGRLKKKTLTWPDSPGLYSCGAQAHCVTSSLRWGSAACGDFPGMWSTFFIPRLKVP